MGEYITQRSIDEFTKYLYHREKALATIQKYVGAVQAFRIFLEGAEFTKEALIRYREHLTGMRCVQTVNVALTAINAYAEFLGRKELRVRYLKTQRKPFVEANRELSREEYRRLLQAAHSTSARTHLLIMTLGSTGIRVSELPYITVEAAKAGRAQIRMKGKCRVILLTRQLCGQLLAYCRQNGIGTGIIFRTRSGAPMDRSNIWHSLKALCAKAGVEKSKVFPHNFRHLFARAFYDVEKNLAHLADVLGHSSLETTRIYVAISTEAHRRILERMKLLE